MVHGIGKLLLLEFTSLFSLHFGSVTEIPWLERFRGKLAQQTVYAEMFVIYPWFWAAHPAVSISTLCLSCLSLIGESELFAKGISFVTNAAVFTLHFYFPWL